MGDYRGGRIVGVKMMHFMTYDHMEVKFNSGLNLIIGLNGSGKSSIMSAICLGLGGKPQHTGRSAQLSDFIKNGNSKAVIELELEDPGSRNVVINRTITTEGNTWLINNSSANFNKVMLIVKKYNIDVGNLCQFLPQEKVADFAKMDKKQRLENMLQAIGEPHLYQQFEALKKLRLSFNTMTKEWEHLNTNKEAEVEKNQRIQAEVDKCREKEELERKLAFAKNQRLALKYEEVRKQLGEAKKKKDNFKRTMMSSEAEINAASALKKDIDTNYNKQIKSVKEEASKLSGVLEKLHKSFNILSKLQEEVDFIKINLQNRINEKENQEAKLAELKKQIDGLQQMHIQIQDTWKETEYLLKSNAQEFKEVSDCLCPINQQVEEIREKIEHREYNVRVYQEAIQRFSNVEKKKLDLLRQRNKDVYVAVEWVKQNMQSFRSTVCLPAFVCMNFEDETKSVFIENLVAQRDLMAFVCCDKYDIERLTTVLRVEKKLFVNIGQDPGEGQQGFNSQPITNQLRSLGVECFVKDLITVPDPVMRYLCSISGLHRIPVCSRQAEHQMDGLLKKFSLFFTPNEKISVKTSKYGAQNQSMRREALRPSNFLPNLSSNAQFLTQYQEEHQKALAELTSLKNDKVSLDTQRDNFERKLEQLRTAQRDLKEKQKKFSSIQVQLKQKQEVYRRRETEVIDVEEEKRKAAAEIYSKIATKTSMLSNQHTLLKEHFGLKLKKVKGIVLAQLLEKSMKATEEKLTNMKELFKEKEGQFVDLLAEYDRLKTEGAALKAKIDAMDDLEEVWDKNNEQTLEEVEQQICTLEAQLNFASDDFDAVMKEYNDRLNVIKKAGLQLSEMKTEIDKVAANLQEKKREWLPAIKSHIGNINEKFSKYYEYLQCAGEICLDPGEDEDDFPKYGLQIRLQYREEEELRELTSAHHSGGECSVAAIIFILSLQELTSVPFRCIDEINQGMDSQNETKIFKLISDAARKSSSQYFLLTPKLVSQMSFEDDVDAHVIILTDKSSRKVNLNELKALLIRD